MANFRTLDLAVEVHRKAEKLEIKDHLKDQLFRAMTSIPLNLAEGNGKYSPKEKKRYYQTAYASQKECQTILKLARIEDEELLGQLDHLGACLYKLLKATNPTL